MLLKSTYILQISSQNCFYWRDIIKIVLGARGMNGLKYTENNLCDVSKISIFLNRFAYLMFYPYLEWYQCSSHTSIILFHFIYLLNSKQLKNINRYSWKFTQCHWILIRLWKRHVRNPWDNLQGVDVHSLFNPLMLTAAKTGLTILDIFF